MNIFNVYNPVCNCHKKTAANFGKGRHPIKKLIFVLSFLLEASINGSAQNAAMKTEVKQLKKEVIATQEKNKKSAAARRNIFIKSKMSKCKII